MKKLMLAFAMASALYAPSAISFGKMLGAFGLLCALLSNRAMALPSDLRGLRGLLIVLALS